MPTELCMLCDGEILANLSYIHDAPEDKRYKARKRCKTCGDAWDCQAVPAGVNAAGQTLIEVIDPRLLRNEVALSRPN